MVKTDAGSTACKNQSTGALNTGLANFNTACASGNDNGRQTNFLNNFTDEFTSQKDSLNSNYDNLKQTANALNDYSGGRTFSQDITARRNELTKQKQTLQKELQTYQEKSQVEDRDFLDSIMHNGPPQDEAFPTLQDVGIGIFLIGWILVGILLIYIQKINVGWKGSFMVFLLYTVATILVYGIIQYLA